MHSAARGPLNFRVLQRAMRVCGCGYENFKFDCVIMQVRRRCLPRIQHSPSRRAFAAGWLVDVCLLIGEWQPRRSRGSTLFELKTEFGVLRLENESYRVMLGQPAPHRSGLYALELFCWIKYSTLEASL